MNSERKKYCFLVLQERNIPDDIITEIYKHYCATLIKSFWKYRKDTILKKMMYYHYFCKIRECSILSLNIMCRPFDPITYSMNGDFSNYLKIHSSKCIDGNYVFSGSYMSHKKRINLHILINNGRIKKVIKYNNFEMIRPLRMDNGDFYFYRTNDKGFLMLHNKKIEKLAYYISYYNDTSFYPLIKEGNIPEFGIFQDNQIIPIKLIWIKSI